MFPRFMTATATHLKTVHYRKCMSGEIEVQVDTWTTRFNVISAKCVSDKGQIDIYGVIPLSDTRPKISAATISYNIKTLTGNVKHTTYVTDPYDFIETIEKLGFACSVNTQEVAGFGRVYKHYDEGPPPTVHVMYTLSYGDLTCYERYKFTVTSIDGEIGCTRGQ